MIESARGDARRGRAVGLPCLAALSLAQIRRAITSNLSILRACGATRASNKLRLAASIHFFAKEALADVAVVRLTVHVPVPVHVPPLQPLNLKPKPGVALRVTTVPGA